MMTVVSIISNIVMNSGNMSLTCFHCFFRKFITSEMSASASATAPTIVVQDDRLRETLQNHFGKVRLVCSVDAMTTAAARSKLKEST